jgi:hypothetical protein
MMGGGKREHCHCWSQCQAIAVHVIQVLGAGTGTAAGQACCGIKSRSIGVWLEVPVHPRQQLGTRQAGQGALLAP